jgi:hypothetical protein
MPDLPDDWSSQQGLCHVLSSRSTSTDSTGGWREEAAASLDRDARICSAVQYCRAEVLAGTLISRYLTVPPPYNGVKSPGNIMLPAATAASGMQMRGKVQYGTGGVCTALYCAVSTELLGLMSPPTVEKWEASGTSWTSTARRGRGGR